MTTTPLFLTKDNMRVKLRHKRYRAVWSPSRSSKTLFNFLTKPFHVSSPQKCWHVSPLLFFHCFLFGFFFCPSEDDVDLEALVNDMNSSLESLYSSCSGQQTESTPLLQQNGQSSCSHHHHTHNNQPLQLHTSQVLTHVSPEPQSSSSISSTADPPQTGLRRSQPMHILAVRLVALDFHSFPFMK